MPFVKWLSEGEKAHLRRARRRLWLALALRLVLFLLVMAVAVSAVTAALHFIAGRWLP